MLFVCTFKETTTQHILYIVHVELIKKDKGTLWSSCRFSNRELRPDCARQHPTYIIIYNIFNKTCYTPYRLHKMHHNSSPNCRRCRTCEGDFLHMLWKCPSLDTYWKYIINIASKTTKVKILPLQPEDMDSGRHTNSECKLYKKILYIARWNSW